MCSAEAFEDVFAGRRASEETRAKGVDQLFSTVRLCSDFMYVFKG